MNRTVEPIGAADREKAGERFGFGKNWKNFSKVLGESRVLAAKESLIELSGLSSMAGMRFLDIGSGSGLFSLAALQLGAEVYAFDFDKDSVACTRSVLERFGEVEESSWRVEEGSVLDERYLESLGQFDVVYSWGVLHHTGALWRALQNAADRVKPGGRLVIALYNDQGGISTYWARVKRSYNRNAFLRTMMTMIHLPYPFVASLVVRWIQGRLDFGSRRGMTYWHDYIDWLGGLPFEVAAPEAVTSFVKERGFSLLRQNLTSRSGCNEFTYVREA